jgi:hypothetical protein
LILCEKLLSSGDRYKTWGEIEAKLGWTQWGGIAGGPDEKVR